MDENALFRLDETAATEATWRAAVDKALKGRPFDSLVATTDDGIELAPLYPPSTTSVPLGRAGAGPWAAIQRIDVADHETANDIALRELHAGAAGLTLVLPAAPTAYGGGVRVTDLDSLDRTLSGVMLDMAPIRLEAGAAGRGLAALAAALVERRGHDPAAVELHFGLDPLGGGAVAGKLSASWDAVAKRTGDTARALHARGFRAPFFLADGRPFHNGGASDAQELASALGAALAYLRAYVDGGLAVADALPLVGFALSGDQSQFATIAKIRALRRLWAKVAAECGVADAHAHVHVETAWRMMTRYDPTTNLLRTTIAAFAAGVGGADSLTVLPFTQAIGLPDRFARRLSRNTHSMLIEESHVDHVVDPAAGSGGVESRTEALAGKAWDLFRAIERKGGLPAALASGWWQGQIAEKRDSRAAAVRRRALPIVGTSEFPLLPDRAVDVLPAPDAPAAPAPGKPLDLPAEGGGKAFAALVAAAGAGASLADIGAGTRAAPASITTTAPLPATRLAEPFEALRDAAETVEDPIDRTVMIAGLGPLAENATRAGWAKAALEAGGLMTSAAATHDTPEEVAEAAASAGVRCVCLAGSDARYAEMAVATVGALKQAGIATIYLAGKPGTAEADYHEAGIDGFLYAGIDLVEALSALHARLGIGD